MTEEIEIKSIATISKGGSLLGLIDIIPDSSIKNGFKKVTENRIFISPMNYNDIRNFSAKAIITSLDFLKTI